MLYALAGMQEEGLIPENVEFSTTKEHPIIKKFGVIEVGDEQLKPDMDLIAHAKGVVKASVYSMKTSLRERAGQTQRWRLLMDIASAPDAESLRQKYSIPKKDGASERFSMNFVTTNFYDEITSPQQRGLLLFFDRVYLTKPGKFRRPVFNFSQIAHDLREAYGS